MTKFCGDFQISKSNILTVIVSYLVYGKTVYFESRILESTEFSAVPNVHKLLLSEEYKFA